MKVGSLKNASDAVHLAPLAGRGRIALAIRVRGALSKRGGNGLEYTCHIPKDIIVPEPHNPVFVIDKPFVASCVARVVSVLPTINFNYKATVAADNIDRVRTNGLLPNKFIAAQPAGPELMPESSFCVRRSPPQISRSLGLVLVSTAHAETPPHPAGFAHRPLPARGERLSPRAVR